MAFIIGAIRLGCGCRKSRLMRPFPVIPGILVLRVAVGWARPVLRRWGREYGWLTARVGAFGHAWTAAIDGSARRFRGRRELTGSGGEEGDRFRLVTQRSQPGEIAGQVACQHSLEESIDGVLQDSVVTVDPAERQGAGAAPGQSGSLLFGSWLEWLDGAMLAGDPFGQLWIGAEAVGADQRPRRDGATQSDDDVVFAAPVEDSLDHTARPIQRGDDGHLFGRQCSLAILALNAAIEAAQAGEAGKGFRVVA